MIRTLGKKVIDLENGTFPVFEMAEKTIIRFSGEGGGDVRATWHDDDGDTHASIQQLNKNKVVYIDSPCQAITVSSKNGEGKIIIEGYN